MDTNYCSIQLSSLWRTSPVALRSHHPDDNNPWTTRALGQPDRSAKRLKHTLPLRRKSSSHFSKSHPRFREMMKWRKIISFAKHQTITTDIGVSQHHQDPVESTLSLRSHWPIAEPASQCQGRQFPASRRQPSNDIYHWEPKYRKTEMWVKTTECQDSFRYGKNAGLSKVTASWLVDPVR